MKRKTFTFWIDIDLDDAFGVQLDIRMRDQSIFRQKRAALKIARKKGWIR